jgi:hypothetical protein
VTAGSDEVRAGLPGDPPVAAGSPVRRRQLLTLAALAALPAACSRSDEPRAGPSVTSSGPAAVTSPGPAPSRATTAKPPSAAPRKALGGGPVKAVAGKVLLGSYLGLSGKSLSESVALRRRQIGRDQRILHIFNAWTDTMRSSYPQTPKGGTVMVSWRGTRYRDINNGSEDARIAQAAKALARYGKPILLRWGWEMNGDWYQWSGPKNDNDTAGYRNAWQRMHRIFGEQGADNVAWVWSPNWNSSPDVAWNDYPRYYPGDGYVDWVGVSGYNLSRQSPQQLFGGIYADYGTRKPLMISEVGAVDRGGSTKADWITLFADWVTAHPAIAAVVWFDTDTHPNVAEKWRIDSTPDALAAYRAMALSPHFGG